MANNIKFIGTEKYNKHLDIEDRSKLIKIIMDHRNQDGSMKITLKRISEMLCKDPTTLSKEIKKHRLFLSKSDYTQAKRSNSMCLNYRTCNKMHLCENIFCNKLCKTCVGCIKKCSDYKERLCIHLTSFPWICNGCLKKPFCHLNKYVYYADTAQKDYISLWKESREGIDISKETFKIIDNTIIESLKKNKQPLSHIYYSNVEIFGVSLRTMYTYFEKGYLTAKNIDLHRKVKYKPRYRNKQKPHKFQKNKYGRSFEDYQEYKFSHPDASIVQMDTVEGKKGGKLLLTLHFVKFNFQLSYLINNKEAINVTFILNKLLLTLGEETFTKLFEVILTDNGVEFSDIDGIENLPNGNGRKCRLFFCHPYSFFEKASCEKNHEYLRIVFPKGTSFDNLKQDIIDLVMSNINAVIRPNYKCSPYDLFTIAFGEDVAYLLKIKKIDSKSVCLSNSLIK